MAKLLIKNSDCLSMDWLSSSLDWFSKFLSKFCHQTIETDKRYVVLFSFSDKCVVIFSSLKMIVSQAYKIIVIIKILSIHSEKRETK
jgi:hypothetical protein